MKVYFRIEDDRTRGGNASLLLKELRGFHGIENCRGYHFFFSEDERAEHKRFCPAMEWTAEEMIRNLEEVRYKGGGVVIFKNMNEQAAAKLMTRTELEEWRKNNED